MNFCFSNWWLAHSGTVDLDTNHREGINAGSVVQYQHLHQLVMSILGAEMQRSDSKFGFGIHESLTVQKDLGDLSVASFSCQVKGCFSMLWKLDKTFENARLISTGHEACSPILNQYRNNEPIQSPASHYSPSKNLLNDVEDYQLKAKKVIWTLKCWIIIEQLASCKLSFP